MADNNKCKVLFCHFSPATTDYTPMDIGYVVSIAKKELPNSFDFYIRRLTHARSKGVDAAARNESRKKIIDADIAVVESISPNVIFICIESILWSKVFALGRAMRMVKVLRKKFPDAFIGLQSYKIQAEQVDAALSKNLFDCVVTGNPEDVFVNIPSILKKSPVAGVHYAGVVADELGAPIIFSRKGLVSRNLDDIPSPYLNHVFDDFLLERQLALGGAFRAFLVSSRGCGFGCFYCYRSVKFEKVEYFSATRFYDEMEYLVSKFSIRRFFVLDDAFLYSKRRLREFAEEFQNRIQANPAMKMVRLYVMARPETIDEEIIDLLAQLGVIYIQIGLQTVNPALQHYMKRTVDTLQFGRIKTWMSKYKMKLHLDIVLGLPGDTSEWMNESLRFALLLSPFSLQIKQFYLNPNTLFQVQSEDYGIVIDNAIMDFDAPYVIKANGIDDEYFHETNEFIMKQINDHPHILWKYLSKKQRYLSSTYYREAEA